MRVASAATTDDPEILRSSQTVSQLIQGQPCFSALAWVTDQLGLVISSTLVRWGLASSRSSLIAETPRSASVFRVRPGPSPVVTQSHSRRILATSPSSIRSAHCSRRPACSFTHSPIGGAAHRPPCSQPADAPPAVDDDATPKGETRGDHNRPPPYKVRSTQWSEAARNRRLSSSCLSAPILSLLFPEDPPAASIV